MHKINDASLHRNNLDRSASPYLLQHVNNPVWWQEWSAGLIRYAAENNIPLFVSVGYSTCHWCHVMASEAFSDEETAKYLNDNFICIKIDREQRPDIDQFMMDYITKQNGSGGWPLNVFLSPSLHPVYALTYAPVYTTRSMYSFLTIAEKVLDYIKKNPEKIVPFTPVEKKPAEMGESSLIRILSDYYDPENGGFGKVQKFPPHSTLLFLLYQLSIDNSPSIKTICTKTLDAIMLKGLNDHLQGGIFRYCVDNEWTIPHFEKMLYDQAMSLWTFSLAYRVTGKESYRFMSEKILKCLDESFEHEGFYIAGHDADTDHREGDTYLWSYNQVTEALTPEEFIRFSEVYYLNESGNFEHRNHLVRKNELPVDDIEEKLLIIRRKRKQPSRDEKILCGMNALAAIALVNAGRFLEKPVLEEKAATLVTNIISSFWNGNTLSHSQYKGVKQDESFLFDGAALLTAITFLFEKDMKWSSLMNEFAAYAGTFAEDGVWLESRSSDFLPVYASWFDHPVPSSVSLAETGLARHSLLTGKDLGNTGYREPFQSDFYNVNAMIHNGLFHVFTSTGFIEWDQLPANSIQVRGVHEQDCFMNICRPLQLSDTTAIILNSPL